MTKDKIVTEAMIEAGKRAFGDTELTGDDYICRALTAAYTAMSTAQEPALDDDALAKAVRSFRNADTEYRRAKNADEQPRLNRAGTRWQCAKWKMFSALDRLQAKAPETGEG